MLLSRQLYKQKRKRYCQAMDCRRGLQTLHPLSRTAPFWPHVRLLLSLDEQANAGPMGPTNTTLPAIVAFLEFRDMCPLQARGLPACLAITSTK